MTFDTVNDGDDPDTAQAIRDEGIALNIATDVLIGVAVAGAVATVVLWLVPLDGDDETRAALQRGVIRW